mgnify:CR=1 FL=1
MLFRSAAADYHMSPRRMGEDNASLVSDRFETAYTTAMFDEKIDVAEHEVLRAAVLLESKHALLQQETSSKMVPRGEWYAEDGRAGSFVLAEEFAKLQNEYVKIHAFASSKRMRQVSMKAKDLKPSAEAIAIAKNVSERTRGFVLAKNVNEYERNGVSFIGSDMLVGSQALRRMEQLRREELVARGLIKTLRLGDGTTHHVYELTDERAQLNMRRFGEKLSGVFGNKIPVVAEGQMSLVEAFMIQAGHQGLIQKYKSDLGQFGYRGYIQALSPEQKEKLGLGIAVANAEAMIVNFIDELNKGPHTFTDAAGQQLTAPYLLEDIISHPELFELYPNLAKMPVRFHDGLGGQMHGPSGYISLGAQLFIRDLVAEGGGLNLSPESGRLPGTVMDQFTPSGGKYSYEQSVRAVVLHEVQHAVQFAEKWKMATPWMAAAVRDDLVSASGFNILADQYVAAEKIFGGKNKTKILHNIDAQKDLPVRAAVHDRLMRTWGSLQDIVSLDTSTDKFIAYATPEESLMALRGIIEAPKAVRLLNDAVPNMAGFLHMMKLNTELQISMRLSGGELGTPELAMLRDWSQKVDDQIEKIDAIKKAVLDGSMTRNDGIMKTYEVFATIKDTFPIALHEIGRAHV